MFYSAFEIGHHNELYMSDGTAAGTGRLKEIRSGSGGSLPWHFCASDGRMFFNANDGIHGAELWVSDATAAGTVCLSDFAPGSAHGRPNEMIDLHGVVVFSAYDPNTGRELFVSDGTVAKTHLLLDIEPGTTGSNPDQLTRVGDEIYFIATTTAFRTGIWTGSIRPHSRLCWSATVCSSSSVLPHHPRMVALCSRHEPARP